MAKSPTSISYSTAITACECCEHWRQSTAQLKIYNAQAFEMSEPRHPALTLLSEILAVKLEPAIISHSASSNTCEKVGQWQRAPALLRRMWAATISACEKGGRRRGNQTRGAAA